MYMEEHLNKPLTEVLNIMQAQSFVSTYFGVGAVKSPLDFWVYQEIVFATKPDVIVEIGNCQGGGALALAHLLDHLGNGTVIGLDINHDQLHPTVRAHPRTTFITGDAVSSFPKVKELVKNSGRVMVIEDSSHTYENTLNVMRTFGPLVTKGNYLVVEDGICHHGLSGGPYPGPYEAIGKFVEETKDFEVDRTREKFFITWNPKGYLRKIR